MTTKRFQITRIDRVPTRGIFGKLITKELVANRSLGGASIIYEYMPPRTELPRVYHRKTTEFIYCLDGWMTARLNGRKFRVKKGGILLLRPGVRHQFATKSSSCASLSVFFPSLTIRKRSDIHTEP